MKSLSKKQIMIAVGSVLAVASMFLLFQNKDSSQVNKFLPSLQMVPGVYLPEDVLATATSTANYFKHELVIYSGDGDEEFKNVDGWGVECSSYHATWKIFSGKIFGVFCGDKQIITFNIKIEPRGVILVEEKTGRVWRREPYYSFEYFENNKNKRLTLYEIPKCDAHACGALIKGIFEEKDGTTYKVISIDDLLDGIPASFGRMSMDRKDVYKNVNIGENRVALLLPWNSMHFGISDSGEYLLEYDNSRLFVPGDFEYSMDNNGASCNPSLTAFDKVTGEPPCYGYTGTITIDEMKSSNGYYDILLNRTGTDYDYDKNKIVKVEPTERYSFKGERYELVK